MMRRRLENFVINREYNETSMRNGKETKDVDVEIQYRMVVGTNVIHATDMLMAKMKNEECCSV